MSQTMTREQAFLEAILDEPDDDLHRLVYADWLEENAWRVAADGKARKGTTLAGDEADVHGDESAVLARAEFIRIQCELALWESFLTHGLNPGSTCGLPAGRTKSGEELLALRRRERELWNTSTNHRPQCWFEIPGWAVACPVDKLEVEYHPPTGSPFVCQVRRGFVAEVSLTCADFAGGACRRCNGTKRIRVTDGEALERIRRRGGHPMFPPGRYAQCHVCRGTGRTPVHAGALFRAAPIEKVTLTDKRPFQFYPVMQEAVGWFLGDDDDPYSLPADLFFLLSGGTEHGATADLPVRRLYVANGDNERYVIEDAVQANDAALDDLSAACVRFGRDAAKGGT